MPAGRASPGEDIAVVLAGYADGSIVSPVVGEEDFKALMSTAHVTIERLRSQIEDLEKTIVEIERGRVE